MAKDWREFEKLVARIEAAIGPAGAAVTSPDHIRDSITGELREVDACIRAQIDTLPIRVLECRNRVNVEDVMWIEQLVTKGRDLGVPITAVSSRGFSEPAIVKANHYGIETRVISEMTQDTMVNWVKIEEVVHLVYFPVIEVVNLEMYREPGDTDAMLHPSVVERVQAGGGDASVFVRHSDSRTFSACQILDVSIRKGLSLFAGVPDDGTKVQKQAVITFARGILRVLTTAGPRDLCKLILRVSVRAEKSSSPLPEMGFCYHGTGRPATYGIESEAEVLGNAVLTSFHQRADTVVLIVTARSRK